ncbi:MAG: hypothetical protein KA239_06805 [Bacteroidia bacterium]|nr:hypothetical protein [Bacteroidia bacterium]
MKRWLFIRLVFFAAWFWTSANGLFAQTEPESATGTLLLQSARDTIEVPVGSALTVNYRHDPRTYRDQRLDVVMDSALIISGDFVDLKYIDRIGVQRKDLHKAGKITLIASVASILAFWFLLACVFAFYMNPALLFVTALLLVLVSIPATLAMPTGLIVGIVLLAVSTKFYHLGYQWKLGTRFSK